MLFLGFFFLSVTVWESLSSLPDTFSANALFCKTVSSSVSFLLLLRPCFFSTDCSFFSLYLAPPQTHSRESGPRATDRPTRPTREEEGARVLLSSPPFSLLRRRPFGEARLECLKVGTPLDGGGRSSTSTSSPLPSPFPATAFFLPPPFCFARVYVQY